MSLIIQKFSTVRAVFICAFFGASAHAVPESPGVDGYLNLAAYSTSQTEFGLFNFYATLGRPLADGLYVKGRVYNFMFLHDIRGIPQAASFEALFPGALIFGVFFTEEPKGLALLWYLLALLNGEAGFQKGGVSLGFVNGFHPFFTRTPYHDAGLRVGFGKRHDFGITFYEQDRMRLSKVNFGVKADYQRYWIP